MERRPVDQMKSNFLSCLECLLITHDTVPVKGGKYIINPHKADLCLLHTLLTPCQEVASSLDKFQKYIFWKRTLTLILNCLLVDENFKGI